MRPVVLNTLAQCLASTKSPAGMKARAGIGISIVIAFLAALTIASSPQLHERLHKVGSQHECAATMIASGNCEHTAPPQLVPKLENAPNSPLFSRNVFNSFSRRFLLQSRNTRRLSLLSAKPPPFACGIDFLPLKQSRPLLAPAFLIHGNRARGAVASIELQS